MNKIFKVKKNALGQSVVCSEMAKSRTKGKIVVGALGIAIGLVLGNSAYAANDTSNISTQFFETGSTNAFNTQTSYNTIARGVESLAMQGGIASGEQSIAIGIDTKAIGLHSSAIGYSSEAIGVNSLALQGGSALKNGSIAIGAAAFANADGAVSLGRGSVSATEKDVQGYLADSKTDYTWQSTSGAVSIGYVGNLDPKAQRITRQIIGLSAGTQDTDAVNVAQLKASTNEIVAVMGGNATVATDGNLTMTNIGGTNSNTIDGAISSVVSKNTAQDTAITAIQAKNTAQDTAITNLDNLAVKYDSATKDKITLISTGTTITNVKAGAVSANSDDAINGSQLFATNTNVTNNTNAITTIQAKDTAQDNAIADVVTKNTAQDTAIANNTAKNTAQDTAIAQINTKNTAQDTAIANLNNTKADKADVDAKNASQDKAIADTNTRIDGLTNTVGTINTKNAEQDKAISDIQAKNNAQDTAIAQKADKTYVDSAVSDIQAKNDAQDKAIANLADVANTKADKTYVDEQNQKQDAMIENVHNELKTEMLALDNIAVKYDDNTTKDKVSFEGANGTTLSNVKAGEVSSTSTDAVNGSQLHASNANISKNSTDIAGVKAVNDVQNTNIANLTIVKANKTDVDAKNKSQDDLIASNADKNTAQDKSISAIQDKNTTQDTAITAIQTKNTAQDNAIADVVTKNTTQDKAISDIQAVNTAQDKAIASLDGLAVKYDSNAKDKVTLANEASIDNVKAGQLSQSSLQAVNGSQLFATNANVATNAKNIKDIQVVNTAQNVSIANLEANKADISYVDAQDGKLADGINNLSAQMTDGYNRLEDKIYQTEERLNSGIANAMAFASLPTPYLPNSHHVAFGTGFYDGASAVSIGATGTGATGKTSYKLGISIADDGRVAGGVGATYRWK